MGPAVNPTMFICGMMGAIENVTAPETGKLCAQYLGPGLQRLNFNYLPFPFNPALTSAPSPDKIIYSAPDLAPGGAGSETAAPAPSVSAWTGGPAVGSPPVSVPEMLLPAEGPP